MASATQIDRTKQTIKDFADLKNISEDESLKIIAQVVKDFYKSIKGETK